MENTEKQHLELITEIIHTARKSFSDNGTVYLLWGWAVSIASLVQFIMIKINMLHSGMVWAVLMPIAGISQFFILGRQKRDKKVKTLVGKILGSLWMAFGVSMCIVIFYAFTGKMEICVLPMILMLYGIGTFVSGVAMEVKPMVVGAIICWGISVLCYFVNNEYQLLLLAIAVIFAYLIPGYTLRTRYHKNV
ncbi:MAG: hypothetical protein WCG87_06865 [Bacteroidota bacterium]